MKPIDKMTLEELKQYREELIKKFKPVGTATQMEELVRVHNKIVELRGMKK